ncbi:MAG: type II secretion system protein GspH [Gammaproteobacteria bacterium RBG_16_51_14]|nr:MAG: type II secretion system protein GspH [Gammaproteobacteria bacterium RBG_16_51_14]
MTTSGYSGFTLFEILVVMAIMTLILALVPPLLPDVIASTRLKSAAREIAAGLNYTRSKAITLQKEMTLTMDVEEKSFRMDEKQKVLNVPDDTTISLITDRSEQISAHKGHIRFFPDGSSTGGQIKLARASKELLVDVHWLTGRVRIFP